MKIESLSARLIDTPLFAGLGTDELDEVLREGSTVLVPVGGRLFTQGDAPSQLYVVVEGRLKVTNVTESGEQIVLGMMGPGDLVGCVAVFRQVPYPATAQALKETNLLSWSATRVFQLFEHMPKLATNALALVSERAEEFMIRMRELATEPVEQRLARNILNLARHREPGCSRGGPPVELSVSRRDLAEMTGTTIFTVSRIVGAWARAGVVAGARERVTILDLNRLSQAAEGEALTNMWGQRSAEIAVPGSRLRSNRAKRSI